MIEEEITQQVKKHLEIYPKDENYIKLLLENKEFSPSDKSYRSWLTYNLSGIDIGNQLIHRLENIIGPIKGMNVLDVGAGGGGNSIAFARHGCVVTSIEIDDLRLAWLRTRVNDHGLSIRILQDRIENINFPKRFDLITCNAVLEHVDVWKTFLGKLLDISNGHIYLCWPNKFSILEIISDQHYGLFGAVFLTGKLQWLQKYYIRIFGINRNAWVTEVPSLRSVKSLVLKRNSNYTIVPMLPVGIEKLDTPNSINNTSARNAIMVLKRFGVSANGLRKIIASQRNSHEILIATK